MAYLLAHLLAATFAGCALVAPVAAETLTVFAAASLKTALDSLGAEWADKTGGKLLPVYGSSAALARQISQGAPADIFISANADWVTWASDQGLLEDGATRDILSNELVLIAPSGSPEVELASPTSILDVLKDGRIAMGLLGAAPVGIYGEAALRNLGLWDDLAGRVAQTDNARAALALVALGEAPLGIVYRSDALAEPRVQIADTFPASSHPPIRYLAASVATSDAETGVDFLDWLGSEAARTVFLESGFRPPGSGR